MIASLDAPSMLRRDAGRTSQSYIPASTPPGGAWSGGAEPLVGERALELPGCFPTGFRHPWLDCPARRATSHSSAQGCHGLVFFTDHLQFSRAFWASARPPFVGKRTLDTNSRWKIRCLQPHTPLGVFQFPLHHTSPSSPLLAPLPTSSSPKELWRDTWFSS